MRPNPFETKYDISRLKDGECFVLTKTSWGGLTVCVEKADKNRKLVPIWWETRHSYKGDLYKTRTPVHDSGFEKMGLDDEIFAQIRGAWLAENLGKELDR